MHAVGVVAEARGLNSADDRRTGTCCCSTSSLLCNADRLLCGWMGSGDTAGEGVVWNNMRKNIGGSQRAASSKFINQHRKELHKNDDTSNGREWRLIPQSTDETKAQDIAGANICCSPPQ